MEIEGSFSKYRLIPDNPSDYNDNDYWVVSKKDGTKYYYGSTANSRQEFDPPYFADHKNDVFRWYLNKIEDSNGNYIIIEYDKEAENENIYLWRIRYTFTKNNTHQTNMVVFTTAARDEEVIKRCLPGKPINTSKLLTRIDTYANGALARRYQLAYNRHEIGTNGNYYKGRSRLVSIQESGTGFTLPPVTFQYHDGPDATFDYVSTTQTTLHLDVAAWVFASDVTGDGRDDIIQYDRANGGDKIYVYRSNGNGTFQSVVSSTLQYNLDGDYDKAFIRDVNGDGRADIVQFEWDRNNDRNLAHVYRSNGNGTFTSARTTELEVELDDSFDRVFLADANGDGRTDLIQYDIHYGVDTVYVHLADSNGYFNYINISTDLRIHLDVNNEDSILLGDVNGDGLIDIIQYDKEYSVDTAYVHLADETGDFNYIGMKTELDLHLDDNDDLVLLNDVNSDGLADLIQYDKKLGGDEVSVYLSNGMQLCDEPDVQLPCDESDDIVTPFFEFVTTTTLDEYTYSNEDVNFSDVNGDGYADIIQYDKYSPDDKVHVYLSYGNGTFTEHDFVTNLHEWLRNEYELVFISDVSGDGLPDVIQYDRDTKDKLHVHLNSGTPASASSPVTPADYLKTINNNLGVTTDLIYHLSFINQYQPHAFFLNTLYSTTTTNLLTGQIMPTTYQYANGYYDVQDRELRGFETVTMIHPDGSKLIETYDQGKTDYFYKGRKTQDRLTTPSNTNLVINTYTWQKAAFSLGAFVKLYQKYTQIFDSGSQTGVSSEIYTYNNANGNVQSIQKSGTDAQIITTEYDYENVANAWRWRVKKETLKNQAAEIVRQTSKTYYTNGNLQTETHLLDGVNDPVTSYTYDAYGNVLNVTDPNNNTTIYEYNDVLEVSKSFPSKIIYPQTGSIIHEVEFPSYDYRFGKPILKIDENENRTTYAYDGLGRPTLVEIRNPSDVLKGKVTAAYNDAYNNRWAITKVFENASGSSTINNIVYFDGFGREIQNLGYGENGTTILTQTSYDLMGRKREFRGPFNNGDTQFPIETTDYDFRGRPKTITTTDNSGSGLQPAITQFAYNGFSTTITDPDGKQKTEKTDHLGRMIQVTEYPSSSPVNTNYWHNAAGDLRFVTDSTGSNTTVIEYDTLGRKTYMNDPDMGVWTYNVYDANGNLKEQANPKLEKTFFDYDELNRVTRKYYSTTDPDVTYEYDLPAVPDSKGRLCKVINSDATIAYNEYDEMGRILSESKIIDGTTYTTQSTYDFSGRLSSMTYPDTYVLNYEYHAGTGLLQNVIDNSGYRYAQYSNYSPSGKIGSIQYGNNASHSFNYDPYSTRLMSFVTQGEGEPLQNRSYQYTLAGDIDRITDNLNSNTYTYDYDNLHRLTSESSSLYANVSFAYNNIGNITSKTIGANTSNYAYSGATGGGPHAVSNITGQLGNSYDFSERTIDYNVESMPVSIVDIMEDGITTQTTLFKYDGNNVRVKKDAPNGINTYYIGNHYEVHNGQATKYIFGNNMRIAQVKGSEKHFFHKDHLMSSTVMTDEDGEKVEYTEYMPFGKTRSHVGQDISDYKFTDQELDKSTGFYNYDARLYDPLIGRFIIADSIVPDWFDPQSLNRYSYCSNNPLIYIDPDGHFAIYVETAPPAGHVGIQTNYNGKTRNYDFGRYRGAYKGNWFKRGPGIRRRTTGTPESSKYEGYKMYKFKTSQKLDNIISKRFRDEFDSGQKTIPKKILEKMNNQKPLKENERYSGEDWTPWGPSCVTDTFDILKEALEGVSNDEQASEALRKEAGQIKDDINEIYDFEDYAPSQVKDALERYEEKENN